MHDALAHSERVLSRTLTALLSVLFLTMLTLAVLQVGLRLFFNTGILWVDPLVRRLVLWVCLLGGVLATMKGRHFQLDVLRTHLRPVLQKWLQFLAEVVAGIVCLAMVLASITFLQITSGDQEAALLDAPAVILECIIPVSFLLMSAIFFGRALKVGTENDMRLLPREEGQ